MPDRIRIRRQQDATILRVERPNKRTRLRVRTTSVGGAGGGGAVDSVNGRTGIVVLDAGDVGALPDDTVIPDISGLQATSEKNQANGYAGLDGDGTIPDNRIPSSIARDTEIGTQITAHDGSGTAHSDIRALISDGIADPGGSNDAILQRKAGAWTDRTIAQVKADLNLPVITTAVAGYTYGMGGVVSADSAYLTSLNKWWGCLCYLPAGSYDRIIFNVLTTGTTTWSMGIYPLNPATGLVDSGTAPLHNIGNVDLSLATGAISVTTSFTLSTPRLVWIGGSVSAYTSTATVRSAGAPDAAITRLVGAPMGGTIAGGVPNGSIATGIRVAAGTGTAGVDNFPANGQFAGSGPKIQVRAA